MSPQVFHILVALADRDRHGYSIMQDVSARAGVRLGPGTLYGSIRRLLEQGLIEELPESNDQRRRYYRLTAAGRAQAAAEAERLEQLVNHARASGLLRN